MYIHIIQYVYICRYTQYRLKMLSLSTTVFLPSGHLRGFWSCLQMVCVLRSPSLSLFFFYSNGNPWLINPWFINMGSTILVANDHLLGYPLSVSLSFFLSSSLHKWNTEPKWIIDDDNKRIGNLTLVQTFSELILLSFSRTYPLVI